MKKLLLILLCLPMIGFGQCEYTLVNYSHNFCYGGNNGFIDITVSNPNSSASWVGPNGFLSSSTNLTNLYAGVYYLTITNTIQVCTLIDSIQIYETLMLDNNATLFPSCDSLCNGYITINPSGGTLPYTYLWSDGQTTNPATNLCPGAYNLTITDVNLCTATNYYLISQSSTQHSYDTLSLTTGIVWNGMFLTVSGDYADTLINLLGCDSIVNLNLTVTATGISEIVNNKSNLVKITDILGRETKQTNQPLFYIYDDGTVEKKIVIE